MEVIPAVILLPAINDHLIHNRLRDIADRVQVRDMEAGRILMIIGEEEDNPIMDHRGVSKAKEIKEIAIIPQLKVTLDKDLPDQPGIGDLMTGRVDQVNDADQEEEGEDREEISNPSI